MNPGKANVKLANKYLTTKDSGFTLLEVLIALLVLSIGLLGLAALQTTGLRSNQMASMRTQATQITYDITDRMRANPVGTTVGDYVVDTTTHPTAAKDCAAVSCIPAELASYDLDDWKDSLLLLPGGTGEIVQTVADPLTHTITVRWNEARDPLVTGTTCPPAAATDLRCYQLVFSN